MWIDLKIVNASWDRRKREESCYKLEHRGQAQNKIVNAHFIRKKITFLWKRKKTRFFTVRTKLNVQYYQSLFLLACTFLVKWLSCLSSSFFSKESEYKNPQIVNIVQPTFVLRIFFLLLRFKTRLHQWCWWKIWDFCYGTNLVNRFSFGSCACPMQKQNACFSCIYFLFDQYPQLTKKISCLSFYSLSPDSLCHFSHTCEAHFLWFAHVAVAFLEHICTFVCNHGIKCFLHPCSIVIFAMHFIITP